MAQHILILSQVLFFLETAIRKITEMPSFKGHFFLLHLVDACFR